MKTLDYIQLDKQKVENVINGLQQLLADFQVYYTNLRGLHWNIKGYSFFVLHSKFEDMYNSAAETIDEIAEYNKLKDVHAKQKIHLTAACFEYPSGY